MHRLDFFWLLHGGGVEWSCFTVSFIFFYPFFCRLAKEEELVAARTKAEELEKENTEIVTKLAKKEQELDLRTQEKVCEIIHVFYVLYVSITYLLRYVLIITRGLFSRFDRYKLFSIYLNIYLHPFLDVWNFLTNFIIHAEVPLVSKKNIWIEGARILTFKMP